MKPPMLKHSCLLIVLLAAAPLLAQQAPFGAEAARPDNDEDRMATPPPVTGDVYPTEGTLEARSNYLRGSLTFSSAYSDNVLGGVSGHPVSDVSYSVWPTVALDKTTTRLHSAITYSPGFTFYQRSNAPNEADHNFALELQYRLSPHVTARFRDTFQKVSNVFNQSNFSAASGVSGSPRPIPVPVIAPLADRVSNTGSGEITYQYSASSMVGAGGTFSNLHYPHPAEVPGLYDSSSSGGSAFYNRRLSKKHYVGSLYQYSRILAYPVMGQSETQTHTIFLFYTVYLKPTLSLSLSGGPQHSDTAQTPLPASRTWSPAAFASLGWQGGRTTLAASYSRIVTGGGGLTGAFHSNTATMTARWQFTRTWSVGVAGGYWIYKTLTPFFLLLNQGGHTVSGSVSLQHQLGEHLRVEAGYTRLHQSYNGIPVIASTPDINREYLSISYHFDRRLGI
jgi:hypothetical protein